MRSTWRFKALLICGPLIYSVAVASGPSDWKSFGVSGARPPEAMFYLNSEIIRSPGHVQVWIEALNEKKLLNFNPRDREPLIARTAKLINSHYVPPLATVSTLTVDQMMYATAWEQIADDSVIKPTMRVLYEIDCAQKRTRTLSVVGLKGFRDVNLEGRWEHMPPESLMETLGKLTCTAT